MARSGFPYPVAVNISEAKTVYHQGIVGLPTIVPQENGTVFVDIGIVIFTVSARLARRLVQASPRETCGSVPVHVGKPDRLGILADAVCNRLRRPLVNVNRHTFIVCSLVQEACETAIVIPDQIV